MLLLLGLTILIVMVFALYCFVFAIVAMEVMKIASMISSRRKTRKYFESIERFRNDFS